MWTRVGSLFVSVCTIVGAVVSGILGSSGAPAPVSQADIDIRLPRRRDDGSGPDWH
jgi:hypothetical protein